MFAAVFDRHYEAVHRYLARRMGPDLADDLAAETFTTAFDVRCRYDTAHPDALPWLFGIATNLVLMRLSAGERDVLLLFAWGDLRYDEIALALRIPIGTVRSRLHRARRRVRELVAESGQYLGVETLTEALDSDG